MRPGPATQAALLSRTLPTATAIFRQGRKIIAHRTPKNAVRRCHPRFAPQGCHSALPSALEGECWRRPQRPGTGSLDMNRISPAIHPRGNHRRAEFWSAALQEHTRALTASTVPQTTSPLQRESTGLLCISCGGGNVLVDDGRKTGLDLSPEPNGTELSRLGSVI